MTIDLIEGSREPYLDLDLGRDGRGGGGGRGGARRKAEQQSWKRNGGLLLLLLACCCLPRRCVPVFVTVFCLRPSSAQQNVK
jgi:hypothetical protein